MNNTLEDWFERIPVVAIIRGVQPDEAVDIGEALYSAGIGIIEVPLNSPEPFDSIQRLSNALSDRCILGAGTVLTEENVTKVADAGGTVIVTPNTNVKVIKRSVELNLTPMPGWATLTEAFTAYEAGARYLKLFPAASYGPGYVKAARAVLPKDTKLLAVGGAGADNAGEWLKGGIDGFGIGTELYASGYTAEDVFKRATRVVEAIKSAQG